MKKISIILIILGALILAYLPISNYLNKINQAEIIKDYNKNIDSIDEDELTKEYEKARLYNENLANENTNDIDYMDVLNLNKDGIMGYLEIPKISLRLPIYHGTREDVLKKGVGHLEKSSLPIGGKNTHSVLMGHSGMNSAELFTRLREIKKEDYFNIYILKRKITYKVFSIEKILPTEIEKLSIQKNDDIVTLITCTPYGVNSHRLLVNGRRCQNY